MERETEAESETQRLSYDFKERARDRDGHPSLNRLISVSWERERERYYRVDRWISVLITGTQY